MKKIPKTIFIFTENQWEQTEFRLLKTNDIFSFDTEEVFSASSDAYIVENDGSWSVLTTNKDTERFLQEKQKEREEKMFGIFS